MNPIKQILTVGLLGSLLLLSFGCSETAPEPAQDEAIQIIETAEPQPTLEIINDEPAEPQPTLDSNEDETGADQPADPSTTPGETQSMPNDPLIDFAIADLAERLSIDIDAIDVLTFQKQTWSDGSIGCPQPGMMYTMALVDGHLIVLNAEGKTYSYHSGGGRDPFLCEASTAQSKTQPIDIHPKLTPGADRESVD